MSNVYYVEPMGIISTIQKAVDVAVAGDIVIISPGTYKESITLRNNGTPTRPIIFMAALPNTVIIDGTGFPYIWNGDPSNTHYGKPDNIWLINLNFQHCSNDVQYGAVLVGNGALVSNVKISHVDSAGLVIQGDGARLYNVIAEYNGEEGIVGNSCSNVLAKNCITRYNNNGMKSPCWAGKANTNLIGGLWYIDPTFEAGGGKWSRTDHCTLDGWDSYGNYGGGISFDINNTNTVVKNTKLHDQIFKKGFWESPGISYEISPGPCLFDRLTCYNNPGGNISIITSSNVEVKNCTFTNNFLSLTNWTRGVTDKLFNINIHDNTLDNCFFWTSGSMTPWDANAAKNMNLNIDHNKYRHVSSTQFQSLAMWDKTMLKTLTDMHNMGIEVHGNVS